MSSQIYLLLALVLYGAGASQVLLQLLTRRNDFASWTLTATLGGFALHTASLSQRWTEAGRFPAIGLHDGSSFLAWVIVLGFLAAYLRTRVDALGIAVYPVVFALVLVAALTQPVSAPRQHTAFLWIHVPLALLGYAPLFVAFAAGLLYLVQERELRSRSPRAFYYLIPSLERCDTIGGGSVRIGLGFLTLAIVTGLLTSRAAHGVYWIWDAKNTSALIAWLIYVAILVARHRSGWGGRRAAWLGVAGFAVVLFTFAVVSLYPAAAASASLTP